MSLSDQDSDFPARAPRNLTGAQVFLCALVFLFLPCLGILACKVALVLRLLPPDF